MLATNPSENMKLWEPVIVNELQPVNQRFSINGSGLQKWQTSLLDIAKH